MMNKFSEYTNGELRDGLDKVLDVACEGVYNQGREEGYKDGIKKGNINGFVKGFTIGAIFSLGLVGLSLWHASDYQNASQDINQVQTTQINELEGELR